MRIIEGTTMTIINTSALRGSTAGSVTHIVQLGNCPGELIEVSEPLSPLTLTAGMWREPYREISASISSNPGAYILIGEEANGEHAVYVGEAGNVLSRLRTHAVPKKMNVIWFAVISSPWPILSKTHARGIEAGIYRLLEPMDGIRLLGSAPPIFPMSATDNLVVETALATARRLLAYAGLPLGLQLPAEVEEESDSGIVGDEVDAGSMPRTYTTYRYCPGPGTCYADLYAVGSDIDGGFMIHAGSEFRSVLSHKLARSITDRRDRLEGGDYLEPIPGVTGRLRLRRPITLSSALVAAKVLSGYGVNDPAVWRALDSAPVTVR